MFIARVLEKEYALRQGFHQTVRLSLRRDFGVSAQSNAQPSRSPKTKFISFDPEALHFGVDKIVALNPRLPEFAR